MINESWKVGFFKENGEFHALGVFPEDAQEDGEKYSAICLVSPIHTLVKEDVEHAHLIAAAPHLLRAAKEAIQQIRYLHEKFKETGTGNNVLAKLEAAVAKYQEYERFKPWVEDPEYISMPSQLKIIE